jgi:hypothetical protein
MVLYRPFYRDFTEWTPARDRGGNQLDRDERARDGGIEKMFDAAIRHRFGVFISRAQMDSSHASKSRVRKHSRRR